MMNTDSQYEVRGIPLTDLIVALRCEADRAEAERFPNVANRQRALALHLENAMLQLDKIPHEGYHLQADLCFRFVPNINPVLDPAYR